MTDMLLYQMTWNKQKAYLQSFAINLLHECCSESDHDKACTQKKGG